MKELSKRAVALPVSAALAVDLRVKELEAQGHDIISFCVGEPDFATPESAAKAGQDAIARDITHYTNAPGTPEIREAVSGYLRRQYALSYAPQEIAVTTGGKYAVYAAVCALCDPGDEVILPAPYWTSYYHIITLAGAVPVVLHTRLEDGWKLSPEAFASAVTPRTKAIILNNPNNPSGALYTKKELTALAEVVCKNDLYVIADEIYDCYNYTEEPFCPIASLSEEMRARTLAVNGMSKAFAMTGWRIGWLAAEKRIVSRVTAILSHTTGCPSSVSQKAACAALSAPGICSDMYAVFRARREAVMDGLAGIEGLKTARPDGAFYIMPVLMGRLAERFGDGSAFALGLLEEADTAVVPCADYGVENGVRLSYTLSPEKIAEGCARIREFVRKSL